jgi:hypothetical protein
MEVNCVLLCFNLRKFIKKYLLITAQLCWADENRYFFIKKIRFAALEAWQFASFRYWDFKIV